MSLTSSRFGNLVNTPRRMTMSLDIGRIDRPIRRLRKFLKEAPKRPGIEQIHDLRTSSRRFETEVDAFGLRGVTEDGYISLSANQDGGDTPADYAHIRFGNGKEGRFVNNCETDKCAADEDFVGERVEHPAEFAGDVELSGDGTVDNIGNCGDEKDYKSCVESKSSLFSVRDIEEHAQEKYSQHEPAEGQYVGNLF